MLIPIWQRLLGVLVYMLPWSDAIPFGKNLLAQVPVVVLRALLLPAMPIWIVQNAIPLKLGSLVLFLVLFLAVVRNPNVPYFLRFNTLQALLLSIILSLLGLVFFEILQK
ncbi:MAG: Tic20 family protein, partial [Prochlorococcus sp.]